MGMGDGMGAKLAEHPAESDEDRRPAGNMLICFQVHDQARRTTSARVLAMKRRVAGLCNE